MSTNVEQCTRCGRIFSFLARGVCSECLRLAEDEFERVRDHLRENPGASVGEVSSATEVPEARIVGWINEGRLERHGTSRLTAEQEAQQQEARQRLLEGVSSALEEAAATQSDDRDERRGGGGMHMRRRS